MDSKQTRSAFSRRSFLQLSGAASAALALRVLSEPELAYAALPDLAQSSAVMINANESPLGPCASAREALAKMMPQGGRYRFDLTRELVKVYAQSIDVPADYVRVFPGSSNPLHYTIMEFCSPTASFVTADPSFEGGMHAGHDAGARVVKVSLTKTYAHDVKAMLAAAPDAGVFYICTPNNPTGTLTSHTDIEYLLANKPKKSMVLVDEAYIHFSDVPSAIDLVKADKDIIVLRTFSKLYGMAGLRCGFAIARPDLVQKVESYGGGNPMPLTGVVGTLASLQEPQLVAQRKRINADVRTEVFSWLDRNGYSYIPSVSNCFMLDTKRPAAQTIAAMAEQNVVIGRVWPVMPTYSRITVGTQEEMDRFKVAFQKVMSGAVTAKLNGNESLQPGHMDGVGARG
jgi:histidinol-phosphate aminotransferase